MKKIVAVLWHNSANRLNMLQSQTDEFVCLKVYSAAALSDGRQDLDKLYRDMDDADAFLFQVTSSDSAWIEIEEYAEKFETPMIYVGGESAGKIKTKDQMKHSAICNQFYVYSGAENMVNMMKYICSQVLHEEMDYQEPIFIPWEGISKYKRLLCLERTIRKRNNCTSCFSHRLVKRRHRSGTGFDKTYREKRIYCIAYFFICNGRYRFRCKRDSICN